jgi:drug/metabolite transporter (DMT)-like permease
VASPRSTPKRSSRSIRCERSGALFAAGGACSYGLTIVCNRELAKRGFPPQASLSIRFAVSAATLFALLGILRRSARPAPGELVRALLLGAVGYATESTLFYSALERGSATAVALLFYAYPAVVTLLELGLRRVRPSVRLFGAMALSLAGTAVIVATGGRLDIEPAGVLCARGSATVFSIYLLTSARIVTRTDALVTGAWVALGAAVAMTSEGAALGTLRSPGGSWWLMVACGLATASAFSLLFAALKRLGASRTAVVMTLEAVSAVALGALLLGERIGLRQALGGAAILIATVWISTAKSPLPLDFSRD